MADEVIVAPPAAGGDGGSGSSAPPAGGNGTPAAAAQDPSQSEEDFFASARPAPETDDGEQLPAEKEEGAQPAAAEGEEFNLAELEPGQPEWMAKVTDPAAKAEILKVLNFQKAASSLFKDQADLEAFVKDYPGGRQQIADERLTVKQAAEIDGHIAANTPEGNATVVGQYLGDAPDGGMGLFSAAAQHIARTNPEGWQKLGGEIINQTLKSSGIGADLATVIGAVRELREAAKNDDGEAFGKAAAKLMGEPKADEKSPADPRLANALQAEKEARESERKAQGTIYTTRNAGMVKAFKDEIHSQVGKFLGNEKIIPKSVSAEDRATMTDKIFGEVIEQLKANSYLDSQVVQLVGVNSADLAKANLKASQGDFDKVVELLKGAANKDLVNRAIAKVVTEYSKARQKTNIETRTNARGGIERKEVGAAAPVGSGFRAIPLAEQLQMTEEQTMAEWSRRTRTA